MKIFGSAWSAALCKGCAHLASLSNSPVYPEWILAIIALESAGTWDPNVLQGKAKLVSELPAYKNEIGFEIIDKRPIIQGTNLRLSHGTGAKGLFQVMPRLIKNTKPPHTMILYGINDPILQLNEGINRFYTSSIANKFNGYKSREALYCANLAPARLIGGKYDEETILYSANPKDIGKSCYWPTAYKQNARPFGLDPDVPKKIESDDEGWRLQMKHLATGLDGAINTSRNRYDAEVEAAYVANISLV